MSLYSLLCIGYQLHCCEPLYTISFTEQFGGMVNKEVQDKKTDTTKDTDFDTAEQKQEPLHVQLQFKGEELCDLPEEEEEDVSNEHNHLAEHRRQEEKMVLEAGSKAAEIAKSIFGKCNV